MNIFGYPLSNLLDISMDIHGYGYPLQGSDQDLNTEIQKQLIFMIDHPIFRIKNIVLNTAFNALLTVVSKIIIPVTFNFSQGFEHYNSSIENTYYQS
jgi:hypothetical protein